VLTTPPQNRGNINITGYRPTKSKYLVGEVKKDAAQVENVEQLLKYVDWVRDEYCFGDYSMIQAVLIASDFSTDVVSHKNTVGKRTYTVGVRPARSLEWTHLKLVRYSYNAANDKIDLAVVA